MPTDEQQPVRLRLLEVLKCIEGVLNKLEDELFVLKTLEGSFALRIGVDVLNIESVLMEKGETRLSWLQDKGEHNCPCLRDAILVEAFDVNTQLTGVALRLEEVVAFESSSFSKERTSLFEGRIPQVDPLACVGSATDVTGIPVSTVFKLGSLEGTCTGCGSVTLISSHASAGILNESFSKPVPIPFLLVQSNVF